MKPHVIYLFAWFFFVLRGVAAPTVLPAIRAEMRALQFDKAIGLADQAVAAKDGDADQALFLKATAEFHRKMFAEAAATADRLTADFPNSEWRHKAVFFSKRRHSLNRRNSPRRSPSNFRVTSAT